MLDSLKHALKQMLVNRRHRLYRRQVEAGSLDYDKWIRELERKEKVDSTYLNDGRNSHTNERKSTGNDGDKNKNDGELAKKVIFIPIGEKTVEEVAEDENVEAHHLVFSMYGGKVSEMGLSLIAEKFEENKNIILIYGDEDIIAKEAAAEGIGMKDAAAKEATAEGIGKKDATAKEAAAEGIGKKDVTAKEAAAEGTGMKDATAKEVITEAAKRTDPWFKPDWSPDTFLSYFYFGALVAVRGKDFKAAYRVLKKENLLENLTQREVLYCLFYEVIRANGGFAVRQEKEKGPVLHLSSVLYHSRKNGYEQIRDLKLKRMAQMKTQQADMQQTGMQQTETQQKEPQPMDIRQTGETKSVERPQLSVIIPSKDNPDVLFLCIDSLVKTTKTNETYEILIIDNGSSEENKAKIEKEIEELELELEKEKAQGQVQAQLLRIRYLYRPMPFNFSKMCNLGAEEAAGDVLLFLNDDMEIISADWLDLLMEKVRLSYVGAVGAKLLYPGTDIIQHAGITNLRVGPAHKLQYLSDAEEYYFGKNRGVHNVLAVTGACLLVRRKVFEQAGGFAEELAVAFNDVDLCYTIHELGYYNVQRNDVILYHHESLSRGKDGESTEKQLRLMREKDLLYEKHQEIYGKDPYYHKNLTTDMLEAEYTPAFHYQVRLDIPWAKVKPCTAQLQKAAEDKCLVVGMECAMDLYKWQYGVPAGKGKVKENPCDMGYYFQGYSFVIGADNACYEKELLLKNTENGEVFSVSLEKCCRQDIKKNLKDQINVDLTGYVAKVQRDKLPEGIYRFGMLARDMCSRQKLVNWSNWVLEIRQDTMTGGQEAADRA